MRISVKLTLFFVCVVCLFVGFSTVLGMTFRDATRSYDEVIAGPIAAADDARVAQVVFKKQVQEWKDILLRGHNPADLAKYRSQFDAKSNEVRSLCSKLESTVTEPIAKNLIGEFLLAHDKLNQEYLAAYDVYVNGNADFKSADKMVRGKDRPATDLFDKVVAKLTTSAKDAVTAQKASSERSNQVAIGAAGALLGLLGIVGGLLLRSVTQRLARLKQMSDRLANADLDGLHIDISGNDEIGAFSSSMQGVHAAISELMDCAESNQAQH